MFGKVKIATIVFSTMVFVVGTAFAAKFDSTWKSPDAQPVDFSGKKIVVYIPAANRAARRAVEEALADAITARGAEGIASYTLLTESEIKDKEVAKKRLQDAQVAGAVVIKASTKGRVPIPTDFWSNYSIDSDRPASGQKDIKMYVETLVYSIDQDALIWTGTSETKTSKLDQFIQDLIGTVAEEMNKQGLLKKQD